MEWFMCVITVLLSVVLLNHAKTKATAPSVEDEVAANLSGLSLVEEVIEEDKARRKCFAYNGYIKIVEQPVKNMRYRYESGGGIIEGFNSSPQNRTYPTIEIGGWKGPVVVVVSLVTIDEIPKPHPHKIVDKDKKIIKNDPHGTQSYKFNVDNETITHSFKGLRIQQVKRIDVKDALKERQRKQIDPFRTGFAHREQSGFIDLNAVKLCFQAFVEKEPNSNKFKKPLMTVVSNTIYNTKDLCDMAICKLSHCSATVAGGLEMILLCEKVTKEDIEVWLFEERGGQVVWKGNCELQVHKQVAITFKTPRYRTLQVEKPVQVSIQLHRPSDGETSEPLPFQLTPLDSGHVSGELSRKKPKMVHEVDRLLLANTKDPLRVASAQVSPGLTVKREPPESSPNSYSVYTPEGKVKVGGISPMYHTPSPMDYNPVSPNYPGMVYQTNIAALASSSYPSRTVTATPLALSPVAGLSPSMQAGLSPQGHSAQGALSPHSPIGRVSPLPPHYVSPPIAGTSDIFMQQPEPLQNGTYLDISSSIHALAGIPPTPLEPMENITINSKDFSAYENLSENISSNLNINCDANMANPPQENMTDSFTRLANTAYSEFEGK